MKKAFTLLSILLLSISLKATIVYVNGAVVGGGDDGTIWTDAYRELKDALLFSPTKTSSSTPSSLQ